MDTGDGTRGEDHARPERLTSAAEDSHGSCQTMMNPSGQVLRRPFSDEAPIDVTGKLDWSSTLPLRKD